MEISRINYKKIKKRYLKFLSSQEVMSEPFRDKLGQLDKFYLPISKMIKKEYIKKKKNTNYRFNRRARNREIDNFKYLKNNLKRGLQIGNSYIFN
jgi:hypothetical protein